MARISIFAGLTRSKPRPLGERNLVRRTRLHFAPLRRRQEHGPTRPGSVRATQSGVTDTAFSHSLNTATLRPRNVFGTPPRNGSSRGVSRSRSGRGQEKSAGGEGCQQWCDVLTFRSSTPTFSSTTKLQQIPNPDCKSLQNVFSCIFV
jgi:hypothetical protein